MTTRVVEQPELGVICSRGGGVVVIIKGKGVCWGQVGRRQGIPSYKLTQSLALSSWAPEVAMHTSLLSRGKGSLRDQQATSWSREAGAGRH